MKTLYITKTADGNQHLLAVLSKKSDGSYGFKPLISSSELTPALSFPLLKKTLENGFNLTQSDIEKWIKSYTPPLENKDLTEMLLEKKGMTEYDEWEWLKSYKPNSMNAIGFFEEIPEGCIRYSQDLRNQAESHPHKVIPMEVLIKACNKKCGEKYDIYEDIAPYLDENTTLEEALAPYLDPNFMEDFKKAFHSNMKAFLFDQIGKDPANSEDNKPAHETTDTKPASKPKDRKSTNKPKASKSAEKPVVCKSAYSAPKRKISADRFISQHSGSLISDKEVIEGVYKNLAEATLASYCSVMRNPKFAISQLKNSLICFANADPNVSVGEIQLPELINRFAEKTGFGNAESTQYQDSTAAVYNTLIKPYFIQTRQQKG